MKILTNLINRSRRFMRECAQFMHFCRNAVSFIFKLVRRLLAPNMPPDKIETFAAQINDRLLALGVPTVTDEWVPDGHVFALVEAGKCGIGLQVKHGNTEIIVWYCAPAADTVAAVGIAAIKRKDADTELFLDPIDHPVPPFVEIILQPMWVELQIKSRQALATEVYGYLSQLVCLSCMVIAKDFDDTEQIVGVLQLVTHKVIYAFFGRNVLGLMGQKLDDFFGDCQCICWEVSEAPRLLTGILPEISKSLHRGHSALLMRKITLDQLVTVTLTMVPPKK